ncbi:MAG: hypothetical protein GX785_20015 [Armatimonadetes bacterium]|nr:hypothetical protein [Armatimonadota bacterium]
MAAAELLIKAAQAGQTLRTVLEVANDVVDVYNGVQQAKGNTEQILAQGGLTQQQANLLAAIKDDTGWCRNLTGEDYLWGVVKDVGAKVTALLEAHAPLSGMYLESPEAVQAFEEGAATGEIDGAAGPIAFRQRSLSYGGLGWVSPPVNYWQPVFNPRLWLIKDSEGQYWNILGLLIDVINELHIYPRP